MLRVVRTSGGEGGIRTLDTGVSPYNGLANSARLVPVAGNQLHTLSVGALIWVKSGCLGGFMHPNMHPILVRSDNGFSGASLMQTTAFLGAGRVISPYDLRTAREWKFAGSRPSVSEDCNSKEIRGQSQERRALNRSANRAR